MSRRPHNWNVNQNESGGEIQKEQFLINFDTDVENVEIEAVLTYFVSGKKKDVVYSIKENIAYDIDWFHLGRGHTPRPDLSWTNLSGPRQ